MDDYEVNGEVPLLNYYVVVSEGLISFIIFLGHRKQQNWQGR
jgi:hypothetical protein